MYSIASLCQDEIPLIFRNVLGSECGSISGSDAAIAYASGSSEVFAVAPVAYASGSSSHAYLGGLAEQMAVALADRLDLFGEEFVHLLRRAANELLLLQHGREIHTGEQRVRL